MKTIQKAQKILLIDDDPAFCYFMQTVAKLRGIELHCFPQLVDATYGRTRLQDFDALILDYDLGDMTGVEVAEYVDYFVGGVPILLISGNHRKAPPLTPWPAAVIAFVHKNEGFDSILSTALSSDRVDDDLYSQIESEEILGQVL